MTAVLRRSDFESALASRLRAAGAVLLEAPQDPARDATKALERLIDALGDQPSAERVWLVYAAVTASLPTADQLLEANRMFALSPADDIALWLLDQAIYNDAPQVAASPIEIVTGRVVVDVDHTARNDLQTGVQRVVRKFMPRWASDHDVVPVAWSASWRCLRELSDRESRRVLSWDQPDDRSEDPAAPTLVLPWRSVVVLPEVAALGACDRLATLAEHSGNSVVVLGHDCIPVISADLVPSWEPERFARFLAVIRHSRRVAGVSLSAAREFRGFVDALPAQGLTGPEVAACPLSSHPVEHPTGRSRLRAGRPPLVLSVGSFEPRKNQLAVLYAAERLWREGLMFELMLLGGSGWGDDQGAMVARLQDAGRPVTAVSRVSDEELVQAYLRARFTVFASLHEGYGLPLAESLGLGTPAVSGSYGSTAETAAHGGALLVDPRNDEAIVGAMRTLLTDDGVLGKLRDEAGRRPERTWSQFAEELWEWLVQPELERLAGGDRC